MSLTTSSISCIIIQKYWRAHIARREVKRRRIIMQEMEDVVKLIGLVLTGDKKDRRVSNWMEVAIIEQLKSVVVARSALKKIQPIVDRTAACGFQNGKTAEFARVVKRLQFEIAAVEQLEQVIESLEVSAIERALVRVRVLKIPESDLTR